jgi:hypothetical protein
MAGESRNVRLSVEVPDDVRSDPKKLEKWLKDLAKDLKDADGVDIAPTGSAGANTVNVTMNIRPCGTRS